MIVRRVTLFIAVLIASCACAFTQVPSNVEIRKILADRIGAEDLGVGIVVGVIDSNGRRVVGYGSLAKNDRRHLDGDTVFEIGSMTKVFTSLLLMDMTRRGEVALTDPVSKYLPAGVKVLSVRTAKSPWRIFPLRAPDSRACPRTSLRKTTRTLTPIIRFSRCTTSFPDIS